MHSPLQSLLLLLLENNRPLVEACDRTKPQFPSVQCASVVYAAHCISTLLYMHFQEVVVVKL